jgi:quercetin dioxygenase-like cupin family protein
MKLLKTANGIIDQRNSMYPCMANKITNETVDTVPYSTIYGFVLTGQACLPNGWTVAQEQYFCYAPGAGDRIQVQGTAVLITRLGFVGQPMVGGPIEQNGRLCYIDGCSDSLLVYPPRLGDSSLNMLYFPPGIDQTYHIHPSVRLGIVARGRGVSCLANETIPLEPGDVFSIEEREYHRFATQHESMTVIAFHPDGDWGPTDQNHTMLNRTYITK